MITKGNKSYSKNPIERSQSARIGSRNSIFYHKASAGQKTINLLSLVMPSEVSMTQITPQEVTGAQLYMNRKNLKLLSTIRNELVQGIDYIVTSSTTIQLIGAYATDGAFADELFVGTIIASPVSDLVVVSARSLVKYYTLGIGETTLVLGSEYILGGNTKVFIKGLLGRKDIDYTEVDSGNGSGSTIQFPAAPVDAAWEITVDFGVVSVTDSNALGAIENLAGAVDKISADLAQLTGGRASDYYTASPSEVDRRTFGTMVLRHEKILASPSIVPAAFDIDWNVSYIFSKSISANATFTFSNVLDGKSVAITVLNTSGADVTVTFPAGVYKDPAALTITAGQAAVYTFIASSGNIFMSYVKGLINT